jgi:hypothetical protein
VKIKIAFYRGKGTLINSIVRWWTGSVYSHAELILNDNVTWIGISPFVKSKISKRIELDVDQSQWDFYAIEITKEQNEIILEFFDETKGEGYDWIGMLLSQFLPCKIKHRKRWYCSEWIAYALRIACVFDWKIIKIYDRKDLSPAVLHKLVTQVSDEKESSKV